MIWASKSGRGVKSRFAGDATLLLPVLREELRTWEFWGFDELPITEQFVKWRSTRAWAGSVHSGRVGGEELMEKVHYLTRGTRDPGEVPTSTRSRSILSHLTYPGEH